MILEQHQNKKLKEWKKKLPKVFRMEEVYELINKSKNLRDYFLLSTMAMTGLRVSEATNLKREDINFKEKYLTVIQGKGGKDRFVTLHNKLIIALDLYFKLEKFEPNDRIFPVTRARVFQIIKDLDSRFHPHTLRHCYATYLYEMDVPIEVISQQLGHSDTKITMLYAHISMKKRGEELKDVFN